jgi:1-acyl-sn-glycerol-3-phosphate acyltransferase
MDHGKIIHDCEPTGPFKHWIGRAWMALLGWRVEGEIPPGGRFILIGAPHTSNWDLPFGLAASYIYRVKIHWLGKESLFRPPFGGLMRWLGGIPVDRSKSNHAVRQIASLFDDRARLVIAIAPCGTRKRMPHWKSGFYWIAYTAQVPVICGALDYKTRTVRIGSAFIPGGDAEADMERVRAFYEGVQGKRHSMTTPVRLKNANPPETERR